MKNEYSISTLGTLTSIIGKNAINVIGDEVKKLGGTRILVVTDKGIEEAGHVDTVKKLLEELSLPVFVYDKVVTDPKDTMVEEALKIINEENVDLVIGLGGGSSMDTAKSASLMKTNEGKLMEYSRINPNKRVFKNNRLPLILVPTTSGTGSEVSPYAVITNTEINRKSNITSKFFLPDVAIIDPMLTCTLNQKWTVSTAFDALTHAIEAYTVRDAVLYGNPAGDSIALKAIELLNQGIRPAYANGDNYEARYQVAVGSHLGGLAMSSGVGVGAAHGLANILSKYYHVPHGESVGILLPYKMEYDLIACPKRFADIAKVMNVYREGMTDMEAGKAAIQAVKDLANDVKLPKLSDYIKDKSEIEGFLEESLNNSCNFVNVREITYEASKQIFMNAFEGK